MRICLTHYAFFPTTGDVESHLLDLGGKLVKQGHEAYALVGSLEARPDREVIEGIHVYRHTLMNPEWIRTEKGKRGLMADEEDPELVEHIRKM